MLVSLKEIAKYVDISDLTPETIAQRLTFSGIEVEQIKKMSDATNLVIGEVLSCLPHPNSDHLHCCKVNVGDEILDIVCGAPNVREGLKVIVALPGAKLPKGEIKKGEIRGQESNGMLCALNELGVDPKFLRQEQIDGIEELPNDAPVGSREVLSYLGLDDVILDLNLLANLKKSQEIDALDYEIKEAETTPPSRYNSGSMILAMENAGKLIEDETLREQIKGAGIGTSATRAEIIKKLERIKYIDINNKTQIITPTKKGEIIYDITLKAIPDMLNPDLTASWEKGLDMVAKKEIASNVFMEKLEKYIKSKIDRLVVKY